MGPLIVTQAAWLSSMVLEEMMVSEGQSKSAVPPQVSFEGAMIWLESGNMKFNAWSNLKWFALIS